MNLLPPCWRIPNLSAGILLLAGVGLVQAQENDTATDRSDASQENFEEIIELSPFEVNVEEDSGYYATNTISGSRINTALQNMPMPIEVITSEFIEDTGALDLRESLRYSAGVILDSQNDAGANLEDVPGGVHNGAGATANITNTTIKLRGFVTDNSLRKGFRRQHGSDSVNIDRIEVVRGPAALLYGIGNFGGIVNYLPKRPLGNQQTTVTALIGKDNLYRATFDTTAPLNEQLGYRVTGALEEAHHWTDWQSRNKWFFSPVVVWEPTNKTKFTFDFEVGNEETNGIGFQRMRARGNLPLDNAIDQPDRLQKSGFVDFDGIDERTFRLSGPDTFVETDSHNILLELNQNLFKGVDLLVGFNRAVADVTLRDIIANSYVQGAGPENLRSTITVLPFETLNGDPIFDAELGDATAGDNIQLTDTVLTYAWSDNNIRRERNEFRAELTLQASLFQSSNWLNQNHLLLFGYSKLEADRITSQFTSGAGARSAQLYKDPNDFSPIRFGEGIQDDGTPDGVSAFSPLQQVSAAENRAENTGLYAVWQGQFWNERITTIAGIRDDTNDQDITDFSFSGGNQTGMTENPSDEQSQTTNQYGVSFEVTPGVSLFALKSEGLEPNFEGLRDGYGDPISATLADSEEIGFKLNLFGGKVALTASTYKINVTGASSLPAWWTPAPGKGRYDPNQPTVYNLIGGVVGDFNPAHVANQGLWDAAIANGDAFYQDGTPYITVLDANGNDTAAGAAYMDAMYAWAANGNGWPGWMFSANDFTDGPGNNAAMDWGAPSAGTFDARLTSEQESTGQEFQVLLTPMDNWQILFNYAHTEREIISAGTFPQYPYPQDRWAIWYFPDGNWGLQGVALNEAYEDPQDTSTWTGGPASTNGESLDDTPEHDIGFWTSYAIQQGPIQGLTLGFGGDYQSKRAYLTGFTVGGNAITDANGNRISLYTDDKLILNAMAKYDFTLFRDNPANIQVNIDNLTNDKDLYGYVYESGLSWRVFFGTTF